MSPSTDKRKQKSHVFPISLDRIQIFGTFLDLYSPRLQKRVQIWCVKCTYNLLIRPVYISKTIYSSTNKTEIWKSQTIHNRKHTIYLKLKIGILSVIQLMLGRPLLSKSNINSYHFHVLSLVRRIEQFNFSKIASYDTT